MNDYFTNFARLASRAKARSAYINARLDEIVTGFDLLPTVVHTNLGNPNNATTAGSTTAYTATVAYVTALAEFQRIVLHINAANTAACTLNLNALGAKAITFADGTAMAAGDLALDSVVEMTYTAEGSGTWLVTNNSGLATAADVVLTNADAIATAADAVSADADATAAAASAALAATYAVFSKYDATTAPDGDDDGANTGGNGVFVDGSEWVDVTADKGYKCVDNATGAAVWRDATVVPANTTTKGIVEKSTSAENITGTAAEKYPSVAGVVQITTKHATLATAQNFARVTVASHATTSAIWAALGNQIDFTGTETVTALPAAPQAGAERTLICAAACSFTAGSNIIIDGVDSAATMACSAGDTVTVMAVTATQFKLRRGKLDGTAEVGGGAAIDFISIATASSDSSVEILLTGGYDEYELHILDMLPANDNVEIWLRTALSGTTFQSGGSDYRWQIASGLGSNAGAQFDNSDSKIRLDGQNVGNATNEYDSFVIKIVKPSVAHRTGITWTFGTFFQDGRPVTGNGYGQRLADAVIVALEIKCSSGNIAEGTFKLLGINNS